MGPYIPAKHQCATQPEPRDRECNDILRTAAVTCAIASGRLDADRRSGRVVFWPTSQDGMNLARG